MSDRAASPADPDGTLPAEGELGDRAREEKDKKKQDKQAEDARRPLDAWERYRALVDAIDEGHQLLEIADRKARFALVIMAALNVMAFVLATRREFLELIPESLRSWLGAYLLAYAFVAVYFFLQAIESLRPRRFHPRLEYPGMAGPEHYPLFLRYHEDVVTRDLEAHRRAWREVRLGQLNAELAVQTHILARTNQDKYAALRRLYVGLRILTLMAAALLTVLAMSSLGGVSLAVGPDKKGSKHAAPAARILGDGERAEAGVREPSGIAFAPRSGHLFVVGDEGRLVERDLAGRVVHEHAIKGDIEDVAVHTPSGALVLLSERKAALVVYDPVAREELRRFKLQDAALLGEEPAEKNQGFEGLGFREDARRAGGGVFYLVHQRSPAMIVSVAFDPQGAASSLGAESVVERWPLPKHGDLTAATWVPSLDRLLVVADARDRLLVLRKDGGLETEVELPGQQQEGLCLDDAGTLWVADDRGGLLRFPGARRALESLVGKGE